MSEINVRPAAHCVTIRSQLQRHDNVPGRHENPGNKRRCLSIMANHNAHNRPVPRQRAGPGALGAIHHPWLDRIGQRTTSTQPGATPVEHCNETGLMLSGAKNDSQRPPFEFRSLSLNPDGIAVFEDIRTSPPLSGSSPRAARASSEASSVSTVAR